MAMMSEGQKEGSIVDDHTVRAVAVLAGTHENDPGSHISSENIASVLPPHHFLLYCD